LKRSLHEQDSLAGKLAEVLSHMWREGDRAAVLSRIVFHERQFEAWWKFELATYLWDFVERTQPGLTVFIESFDRADVALGHATERGLFDYASSPRIPIELKTIGTFWQNPGKAFQEAGKKRLEQDMKDLAEGLRNVDPFGATPHHSSRLKSAYLRKVQRGGTPSRAHSWISFGSRRSNFLATVSIHPRCIRPSTHVDPRRMTFASALDRSSAGATVGAVRERRCPARSPGAVPSPQIARCRRSSS
jgi:hypothetical protein